MQYKGNKLEKAIEINGEKLSPYIPDAKLIKAVNHAIILKRPLLLKGEPGTGKTLLAKAVAHEFGVFPERYFEWRIKSTSKAQDGLYAFDHLKRLHDVQALNKNVSDSSEVLSSNISLINYLIKGPLYLAFKAAIDNPKEPVILLIDEVDKADIDFPNDLLHELDQKSFVINELEKETYSNIREIKVPQDSNLIVFITSNNEKELPDAFLRRCLFHYIAFPDDEHLKDIIKRHYPSLETEIVDHIVKEFENVRSTYERDIPNDKKPATSELLDWCRLINHFLEHEDGDEIVKLKADFSVLLKSENALKIFNTEEIEL